MPAPQCVDCITEGQTRYRPTPHGGPRSPLCVSHYRARRRARSARAHELRLGKVYGITAEEYWKLYAAQGGKCAICQRAVGRARRLAVDHDHETGMVRGILCSPCNVMIGRYDVEAFMRVLVYLNKPPAIEVIGCRHVPLTDASENESTP